MLGVAVVKRGRAVPLLTIIATVTVRPAESLTEILAAPSATPPKVSTEPFTPAIAIAVLLLTAVYGDEPPLILKSEAEPTPTVNEAGAVVNKGATTTDPPELVPALPPPPPHAASTMMNARLRTYLTKLILIFL